MSEQDGPVGLSERTRGLTAPLRRMIRTESGSALVLVAGVLAALVWANVGASYETVWATELSLRLGRWGLSLDLREWLDDGLMALFFFVVGLEARRELDLGDLRERRRILLPVTAGLMGLVVPIGIYLTVTHAGPGAGGWGVAMSTDTALALGLLTVLGRDVPDPVRVFLLTVFVIDDVVSLLVIAVAYSEHVALRPLAVAAVVLALLLVARAAGLRNGFAYAAGGVVLWGAMHASGVDPVVVGLVLGLLTPAWTPSREELERATTLVRDFREQPTAGLARTARAGLSASLSSNDRMQDLWLPWTSYVIVPLFALANAGVVVDAGFLRRAYTSPVTLGIIAAYVVGKPVAVLGTSWVLQRVSGGRLRPGIGWAAVGGAGAIAGMGFTVSILIAGLAFRGERLAQAKLGVLTSVLLAALVTAAVFRLTALLPAGRRAVALLGRSEQLLDLDPPVDPDRDHVRGPADASVTVVEYGDFQCPFCGQAEPAVRALLTDTDLRYVWRHLPLPDVHPQAELAAEAAEAAARQDAFWEMWERLITHQDDLHPRGLVGHAEALGLDVEAFGAALRERTYRRRVDRDVGSADRSGVSGTPTFFVNGRRHYGAYDLPALKQAVAVARARSLVDAG